MRLLLFPEVVQHNSKKTVVKDYLTQGENKIRNMFLLSDFLKKDINKLTTAVAEKY